MHELKTFNIIMRDLVSFLTHIYITIKEIVCMLSVSNHVKLRWYLNVLDIFFLFTL